MNNEKQLNLLKIIAAGLFLSAIAMRLSLFYRSLQYDELWSLQFFSQMEWKKILFDLALPNNHPLNTLGIKIISQICDDIFCIRIFPLLCGILLPIPIGFAVSTWYNDKRTGMLAAVLTAFSSPLVIYSALARGYIIQAFFFALTAAGFACFSEKNVKKHSITGFFLIAIGGAGTILSVPTGVVFLAALVLAIFIPNRRKKPHKLLIAVLAAGAVLTAAYYTATYSALTSATKWSVGGNCFINCGNILYHTGAGLLISSLMAAYLAPEKTIPLLSIPIFVLLTGAVTGLGPDRTYIIFALVFAATGAAGIIELFKKNTLQKFAAAFLLIIFAGCQFLNAENFLLPDWKLADTKTSSTTISVYPANSCYPLLWNKGTDFLKSYQNTVGKNFLDTVRVYAPEGVFNGMDSAFGEKQIKTSLTAEGGTDKVLGEYHCYKLELCQDNIPEKGFFLVAFPINTYHPPPPENSLRLNPHLESSPDGSGRCALYFTSAPPAAGTGANIYQIK